jgi:hypothetical protein
MTDWAISGVDEMVAVFRCDRLSGEQRPLRAAMIDLIGQPEGVNL